MMLIAFQQRGYHQQQMRLHRLCKLVLLLFSKNARGIATPSTSRFTFPIYFDSTNSWHRDKLYHPEQPERINACIRALVDLKQQHFSDIIDLVDVADEGSNIPLITTPLDSVFSHHPFTKKELEHAKSILIRTHNEEIVSKMEKMCQEGRQKRIEEGREPLGHMGYIDYDTYVTTETFNVCLRSMAAWIRACNNSNRHSGSIAGISMALTRPPGHHATKNLQNGFCLFNFAAGASIHYILQDCTKKVSILDWDVHYGQGVSDIVRAFENIRYVSIHQVPSFPYEGEVLGNPYPNIMTIPMRPDTTWTCGYQDLFQKALNFLSNENEWVPDLIIICSGYDALASDELASTSLTASDFGTMTSQLLQHIMNHGLKRNDDYSPTVIFGLEGGYQLNDVGPSGNLPQAVVETVKAGIEYCKTKT